MRKADATRKSLHVEARSDPSRDVTEVTIYAPDHPGLFAQIAGAMSLSGASIVGAKVVTLANGMALDVFHIQDLGGRPFDSDDRLSDWPGASRRPSSATFSRPANCRRCGRVPCRAGHGSSRCRRG